MEDDLLREGRAGGEAVDWAYDGGGAVVVVVVVAAGDSVAGAGVGLLLREEEEEVPGPERGDSAGRRALMESKVESLMTPFSRRDSSS